MLRRCTLMFCGVLLSALVGEGALRLLPVATGYQYRPVNAVSPVLRGTPYAPYTYSTGWNFRLVTHGALNNTGYLSDRDYAYDKAGSVLVIGDSYVQAAAIPRDRNLHAVLASRLKPVGVYGLARAGGALPDYLAMARWGKEQYRPVAFVFLIVSGDVDDSVHAKTGSDYFRETGQGYVDTRVDRDELGLPQKILNASKLFRYFYDNLAFTVNFPVRPQLPALAVRDDPQKRARYARISEYFLQELERIADRQHVVLLIHRSRRSGSFSYDVDVDVLRDIARQRGFHVIDLAQPFTQYETRTGQHLDFSPIDTHWNALAQEVAGNELMPVLEGMLEGGHPSVTQ